MAYFQFHTYSTCRQVEISFFINAPDCTFSSRKIKSSLPWEGGHPPPTPSLAMIEERKKMCLKLLILSFLITDFSLKRLAGLHTTNCLETWFKWSSIECLLSFESPCSAFHSGLVILTLFIFTSSGGCPSRKSGGDMRWHSYKNTR